MSSSRNRTPWCASETSPGRRNPLPPPSRPAVEIEWWGARNGGRVSRPRPASSPATECSCEASRASSRESAGRIVANRRASMVLPAPGEPTKNTLWPPAAATSRARRAGAWPRTSARSTDGGRRSAGRRRHRRRRAPRCRAGTRRPRPARSRRRPRGPRPAPPRARCRRARRRRRVRRAPRRWRPRARPAWPRARPSATARRRTPTRRRRARAPAPWRPGRSWRPAGRARALLAKVPGDRFTTTRRSGHSRPADSTAGRIRSRASCTAAPGRPVSVSDGSPRPTCASTVTGCPRPRGRSPPRPVRTWRANATSRRRHPLVRDGLVRGRAQNASSKTSTVDAGAPHRDARDVEAYGVGGIARSRGTARRAAGACAASAIRPPRTRRRTRGRAASSPRRSPAARRARRRGRSPRPGSASCEPRPGSRAPNTTRPRRPRRRRLVPNGDP